MTRPTKSPLPSAIASEDSGDSYLQIVGDRVRAARARRGMTRKGLSRDSGVSERYLAQLESGQGNVSILLLRQIAQAMNMSIADLVNELPDRPVEFSLVTELLARLSPEELGETYRMLQRRTAARDAKRRRIALIGLRGAGKSTLGQALAQRLGVPFIQLDRAVEQEAGMQLSEIFDLVGQSAFRRLERQALERVIENHEQAVIETGGGLVSEASTFDRLLATCYTIWLQAAPEQHMQRVMAQGDRRPMAGNREAMLDLQRILAERDALYRKADAALDTSGRSEEECLAALTEMARPVITG